MLLVDIHAKSKLLIAVLCEKFEVCHYCHVNEASFQLNNDSNLFLKGQAAELVLVDKIFCSDWLRRE